MARDGSVIIERAVSEATCDRIIEEMREHRRGENEKADLLDGAGAQHFVAVLLLDRLDVILPDGDLGRERLLEGLQRRSLRKLFRKRRLVRGARQHADLG